MKLSFIKFSHQEHITFNQTRLLVVVLNVILVQNVVEVKDLLVTLSINFKLFKLFDNN